QDTAGNPGSARAELKVTRWKWAFEAASLIRGSPALGEKGTVYFATTGGNAFGVNPSGMELWEKTLSGSIDGSPVVRTPSGGAELVYMASNILNGTELYALDGATGDQRIRCSYTVTSGAIPRVQSAAALMRTTVAAVPLETALFVLSNYGSAVGIRPTGQGQSTLECVLADPSRGQLAATVNAGLVATDAGQFIYPTDARRIVRYPFGSGTATWTAIAGGGSGQRIFGVALVGDTVFASGGSDFDQGGLYSIPFGSTGLINANALNGTAGGRINQFISTQEGRLYFGREISASQGEVGLYDPTTMNVRPPATGAGIFQAAPVLGADGRLYTLNVAGELTARSATDLTRQWNVTGIGAAGEASPTLDCTRGADGTPLGATSPGVLYVPVANRLYAFVVDSPSLFKTPGSWPKFQHDVRNTGNPATPITNCP
ncbi:MAG TPA: PQQ-binding-like beta-propeller repeat protein, partial [Myxococcaceae bacterium]